MYEPLSARRWTPKNLAINCAVGQLILVSNCDRHRGVKVVPNSIGLSAEIASQPGRQLVDYILNVRRSWLVSI